MIAIDRIKEAFAAKLLALLKERGMRQAALARALYTNRASICEYTKGWRMPSLETAIRIADLLGVTMDELCCSSELRGRREAQDEHRN